MIDHPGYLLDTDHSVYWMNGNAVIQAKVEAVGWDQIAVSAVTVGELFFGAHNSQRLQENIDRAEDFLSRLTIIELDEAGGRAFGRLKAQIRQAGQTVADPDLFIAATALSSDRVFVSNNTRHFERIPGLTLENWYAP
jgi:tRNA(fMet)-specific endonuclease VapC